MAKSPSVNLIERDVSSYAVTSATTTLAVVGYATKGPIGQATKVVSFKEFREKFGYPTALGYSSLLVKRAFNQGNSLIFYRVGETSGTEAALASNILVKNAVAAVNGYVELTRTTDVLSDTSGYTAGEEYGVSVASKLFYLRAPYSGRWTLSDMLSQLTAGLPATAGYQEFTERSISGFEPGPYGFTLTIDGTVVASADGSTNNDIIIDVVSSDDLTTLKNKIAAAVAGGARSYQASLFAAPIASIDDVINTTGLTDSRYNFNILLASGGTPTQVVVSNITTSTTYKQLETIINNELARRNINAYCVSTLDGYYFYSKTYGTTSYVLVSAGTPDAIKGPDLIGALLVTPGSNVAAKAGNTAAVVSIDSYTQRIKIISSTTGATSSVAIAVPELITDDDHNLVTLLGTEVARAGQALLDTVSFSRDTVTRKLRFSAVSSITPPTVIDAGTEYNFINLMGGLGTPVTGNEATTTLTTDTIAFTSKETGSSTALISVEKSSYVNPADSTTVNTIKVFYDGDLKETFEDVSLTVADDDYFVNVINDAEEGSEWITAYVYKNANPATTSVIFPDGTYTLGTALSSSSVVFDPTTMDDDDIADYDYKVGTDGVISTGGESLFVDALSTAGDLGNVDLFDFHLLATPDNNEEAVQNAAITLAESRKDFLYLVDPPFGLSYSEVKDWHNGSGHGRYSAVNSSYAAVYWPWLKDYDSYARKYVWAPPSVFMIEKLLETDRVYFPWAAPAGDTRGKITANDLEVSPSFAEREEIYGDFNCINPIVDFVSKGLIIFGQKTALRENKASNRINVRRMVIFAKKLIKLALDSMLFEPNNTDSWQRATALVNAILENIRQNGGIDQYLVVIDSSTNTPDVIAQSMMKGIIKIVPVGTIEIIEMSINLYASGAVIE